MRLIIKFEALIINTNLILFISNKKMFMSIKDNFYFYHVVFTL